MDFISDWAIFIAGGVILFAHVIHRYNQADKLSSIGHDPVLSRVHMKALTSPEEYARGSAFYSAIFVAIYVFLAFSPGFAEQVFVYLDGSTSRAPSSANSQSWTGRDLIETRSSAFQPIALAAAILTGVSLPLFEKPENLVRSIAYWIAGIPRGVHRASATLRKAPFSDFAADKELAFLSTFTDFSDGKDWSPLSQRTVDEIKHSLRIIDLLRPAVVGNQAGTLFVVEPVKEVDAIVGEVREQLDQITAALRSLDDDFDSLQALHGRARKTANVMQSVFALNYVRSRREMAPSDGTPADRIVNHIKDHQDNQSLQDLTFALFIGLVMTCFVFIARVWIVNADAEPERFAHQMMTYPRQAMTLPVVALSVATLLGMYLRSVRVDQELWPKWPGNKPPVLSFIKAAIMPSGVAVLLGAATSIILERVSQSFLLGSGQLTTSFKEFTASVIIVEWWMWLSYFLVLTLLVACFYIVADLHNRPKMKWWKTLFLSVILSLPVLALFLVLGLLNPSGEYFLPQNSSQRLNYPDMLDDFFSMAFSGAMVLAFYAIFAEIAEVGEEDASTGGKTKTARKRSEIKLVRTPTAGIFVAFLFSLFVIQSEAGTIKIGVRADAEPFSYRISKTSPHLALRAGGSAPSEGVLSELTADGNEVYYAGFVVFVCAAVLQDMSARITDLRVELVAVNASDRFNALADGDIDVLCDPSTITGERVGQPGLLVSQPIYLSGQAIARRPDKELWEHHWPCRGPLIGVVAGTTSDAAAVKRIKNLGGLPVTFAKRLSDWLDSSGQIPEAKCQSQGIPTREPTDDWEADKAKIPIRKYATHDLAADAFCNGEVAFYVGDFEILKRKLQRRASEAGGCKWEGLTKVYSDERYGIFARIDAEIDEKNKYVLLFLKILGEKIHAGSDSLLFEAMKESMGIDNLKDKRLDVFFWSVISSLE